MEYTKGECGCSLEEVVFTYPTGQSGVKPKIIYCPLHKSAPDLYEACRELLAVVAHNALPSVAKINRAEKAINKAGGK